RSALLREPRGLRSRALLARAQRLAAALRLSALRRRAAHLYRGAVRDVGSAARAGHAAAEVPARSGARPPRRSRAAGDAAPPARDADAAAAARLNGQPRRPRGPGGLRRAETVNRSGRARPP